MSYLHCHLSAFFLTLLSHRSTIVPSDQRGGLKPGGSIIIKEEKEGEGAPMYGFVAGKVISAPGAAEDGSPTGGDFLGLRGAPFASFVLLSECE